MRKPLPPPGEPIAEGLAGILPKGWMSEPRVMGTLAGLIVFLATCMSGGVLYQHFNSALGEEVRNSLQHSASTIATLVDGDAHGHFTARSQEKSPEYKRAIAPLRSVLASRKDISFIYTCVLRGKKVYFVLDPTKQGDANKDGVDDKSHIFQTYPNVSPAMLRALKTGTPQADEVPYKDGWGSFVSGYAPVRNRHGAYVAILGVDMTSKDYQDRLSGMHYAALLGLGMSLLMSVCVGATVARLASRTAQSRENLETRVRERTAELAEANAVLVREIGEREEAVSAWQNSEAQLAHDAFHDALTGLPNRVLFADRLERALLRARASNYKAVAVLFLDLDNFKIINDSLGHAAGDRLLITVAERLQTCIRPGDTVARLGGDEFTILLEDVRDVDEVALVADRITQVLGLPVRIYEREVFTAASVGVAISENWDVAPEVLLRDADTAMYQAKAAGKGHYVVFERSMNDRILERLELEADLRRAVENREFRLYYQPIVDLDTGAMRGVEALVRWNHPKRGWIPPGKFIYIAEETGLIVPLGRWVLEEACRQANIWHTRYPDDKPLVISVNLSARQLQEGSLVDEVARVLAVSALSADHLELEITESVMMIDAEATIARLRALKALGVRLAVDDFGTGYSSMAYLSKFPLDTLKIDRSFVETLGPQDEKRAIVRAILTLAKTLNLSVTSEGIETPEQLEQLREMGSNRGQGFYFAHPLTPEMVNGLLGLAAPHSYAVLGKKAAPRLTDIIPPSAQLQERVVLPERPSAPASSSPVLPEAREDLPRMRRRGVARKANSPVSTGVPHSSGENI